MMDTLSRGRVATLGLTPTTTRWHAECSQRAHAARHPGVGHRLDRGPGRAMGGFFWAHAAPGRTRRGRPGRHRIRPRPNGGSRCGATRGRTRGPAGARARPIDQHGCQFWLGRPLRKAAQAEREWYKWSGYTWSNDRGLRAELVFDLAEKRGSILRIMRPAILECLKEKS